MAERATVVFLLRARPGSWCGGGGRGLLGIATHEHLEKCYLREGAGGGGGGNVLRVTSE